MTRIAATCAIAAGVVLIAANWAIYRADIDVSQISPKFHAANEQPQSGDALRAEDVGDFSVTLERPLFSKSRRRFVPAAIEPDPIEAMAEVDPGAAPEPLIPETLPALLGISIATDTSKALFHAEGEQARWHGKGEILAGWVVVSIEKDRVLLERNGQKKEVSLYPASAATSSRDPGNVQ